jgi:DNA invertase Pin-like site-specific DNA recombinase
MKLLYCRVSTTEQCELRQTELAKELGIEEENIFLDKQSGKDTNRKELQRLLEFCRKGDIVYTESISRIARNTKDLLEIIEKLNQKQVEFVSLKEKIDTSTPIGKFLLCIFGAMAELERENILQRQREGIAIARTFNKYQGKPQMKIDKEKFIKVCAEWRKGNKTATQCMKELNLKPNTFYRRVKEWNI